MTYFELKKLIDEYKKDRIEEFLKEHGNDDLSKLDYITISVYSPIYQQFDVFEDIEDTLTLDELVFELNKLQIDRGGSWQLHFSNDDDDYKWLEIGENFVEWDF